VSGPEEGVRRTYDLVAHDYDREIGDELDHKPLDRALLAALVELVGSGRLADVGCGPGHVTRFLAALHDDVVGIDLSPGMVEIARSHAPDLSFEVGTMLALPVDDGSWAGAVAMYSVIHLSTDERRTTFTELARALRPGGHLLMAFHVSDMEQPAGSSKHLTSWFGYDVDVSVGCLDPDVIAAELAAAGLTVRATTLREPGEGEYPSRRAYLLARRS
jgi:ubiquinone/menaquinone biosynthesis C-methylase UbiE